MTSALIEIASWLIICPVLFALMAANRQSGIVRDRFSRTGQRWDARDTFEVKDAIYGVAAFCCPMAFTFAFVGAKVELPVWLWWILLLAVGAVGTLPLFFHSRWSIAQRKIFDGAFPRSEPSPAP